MKIGINASFLSDRPSGVGVYTREIASRLCLINPETVVYSAVEMGKSCRNHIHFLPERVKGSVALINNIIRALHMNLVIPRLVKRDHADILYCPILEYPFLPTAPLVVTVHDIHPLYFPEQFGLSAKHFRVSLKLLPRLVRHVIVPSEFVKRELEGSIGLREVPVSVVPNGFNSGIFTPPESPDKTDEILLRYGISRPYILFVGSLFPYKNVDTLVDSFLEVSGRIPHDLVIIGRADVSGRTPDIHKRIRHIDTIPYEILPYFYAGAAMLIHPSFFEGFGMTVLEAMACGTPVISSNGGSLPEVVGGAGLLFDPRDTSQLSRLILSVHESKSLKNSLIEKGFRNIKRFSWDTSAAAIHRILNDTAESSS